MQFHKYNSIENAYREAFINKCQIHGNHLEWVALEKIHGANMQIMYDGIEVKFAKRSGFIAEGENFYNHLLFKDEFSDKVKTIYEYLRLTHGDVSISVCGEIYGASVQHGVYYRNDVSFIMFDIFVLSKVTNAGYWLSYSDCRKISSLFDMPMVPEIAIGSFADVLKQNNTFDSLIANRKDNLAEGFVMKPSAQGLHLLPSGERMIIKSKTETFSERSNKVKRSYAVKELTSEQNQALDEFASYINENRLAAVVSKIGEFDPKIFGKYAGLLFKDALDDYRKDQSPSADTLSAIQKKAMELSMDLIRSVYFK